MRSAVFYPAGQLISLSSHFFLSRRSISRVSWIYRHFSQKIADAISVGGGGEEVGVSPNPVHTGWGPQVCCICNFWWIMPVGSGQPISLLVFKQSLRGHEQCLQQSVCFINISMWHKIFSTMKYEVWLYLGMVYFYCIPVFEEMRVSRWGTRRSEIKVGLGGYWFVG